MTKKQLVSALQLIQEQQEEIGEDMDGCQLGDDHAEADSLLLEFINDDRVTLAYGAIEKAY